VKARLDFNTSDWRIKRSLSECCGFKFSRGFGRGRAMKVRQIIHSGGFEPEEVKLLEAVFDASWHRIEGHYPAEGTECDAARERLATVVVTLGHTCRHLDAAELQTRAIAMLDPRE
jgi:hypothetical protein